MIRILSMLLLLITVVCNTQAQIILNSKSKPKITLPPSLKGSAPAANTSRPTDQMMAEGLKGALEQGFGAAADKLSIVDGFFGNAMIKILFPPEAKKAESTLRSMGMGKVCDDVILSLNRAAEDASKQAKPIFISAIKQMTITDAVNIVLGPNDGATQFFRKTIGNELQAKFQPVVATNLDKVQATKYWGTAMNTYNSIPFNTNKINPNLPEYVTLKAIDGLFIVLAEEEKKIRKDPVSRSTQIIKDIFGWADKNKK
jgi:hypothetical protein